MGARHVLYSRAAPSLRQSPGRVALPLLGIVQSLCLRQKNQQDLNIERRSAGSSVQEMHI